MIPRQRLGRFLVKPWRQKCAAVLATLQVAVVFVTSRIPKHLRATARFVARSYLHHGSLPRLLLFYGFSPGDDLMCTAVLRELRQRGTAHLGMVSNHPQLYSENDDLVCVLPAGNAHSLHYPPLATYQVLVGLMGGEFKHLEYALFDGVDHSVVPSRHIIAELCASAGVNGLVAIRPYMTLTDGEKAAAIWAKGRIVIQSSGMGARHPIRNKQWYPERFQHVVDAFAGAQEFIQLGAVDDPPLGQAVDLRGRTTIRESAAILYNARMYVGTVGFLMHLARAVDCPSVIIFGGREAPWQSGYVGNFNLYTPLSCAPCWRWNTCDFDLRCMQEIRSADVINAIGEMLTRPRGPLEVEFIMIDTLQKDENSAHLPSQ